MEQYILSENIIYKNNMFTCSNITNIDYYWYSTTKKSYFNDINTYTSDTSQIVNQDLQNNSFNYSIKNKTIYFYYTYPDLSTLKSSDINIKCNLSNNVQNISLFITKNNDWTSFEHFNGEYSDNNIKFEFISDNIPDTFNKIHFVITFIDDSTNSISINEITGCPLNKPNFLVLNLGDELCLGTNNYCNDCFSNPNLNLKETMFYNFHDNLYEDFHFSKNLGVNHKKFNYIIPFFFAREMKNIQDNINTGIVTYGEENINLDDFEKIVDELILKIPDLINNSLVTKVNLININYGFTESFLKNEIYLNKFQNIINKLKNNRYIGEDIPIFILGSIFNNKNNETLIEFNKDNNKYTKFIETSELKLTNNNYDIDSCEKIGREMIINYKKIMENTDLNKLNMVEVDKDIDYESYPEFSDKINISLIDTIDGSSLLTIFGDETIEYTAGNNPTRIKISPSGQLMFVALLNGAVLIYVKSNNKWIRQDLLFYSLGNLNNVGHKGLTGLILCENFDETSEIEENKYIFLNYQIKPVDSQYGYNRSTRITFSFNLLNEFIGIDPIDIWNGNFYSSGHQIHDGWVDNNKLYIAVGDQFYQPYSDWMGNLDSDVGKILEMDYDGNNKRIVAYNVRDPYSLFKFPYFMDANERVLAVANGTSRARIWFATIGYGKDNWDTGWTGDDTDLTFSVNTDSNHPNPISKPNAILRVFEDDPSPNGLDMFLNTNPIFEKNTILPKPENNKSATGIVIFYGKSTGLNDGGDSWEKKICIANLTNLNAPQPDLLLTKIIKRKSTLNGTWGNPLDCAIDIDGSVIFCDVVTGKIYKFEFIE